MFQKDLNISSWESGHKLCCAAFNDVCFFSVLHLLIIWTGVFISIVNTGLQSESIWVVLFCKVFGNSSSKLLKLGLWAPDGWLGQIHDGVSLLSSLAQIQSLTTSVFKGFYYQLSDLLWGGKRRQKVNNCRHKIEIALECSPLMMVILQWSIWFLCWAMSTTVLCDSSIFFHGASLIIQQSDSFYWL